VAALTKRFAEIGAPWHTRVRPETFATRLNDMGFSAVTYMMPEEANVRHFDNRADGLRASEQDLVIQQLSESSAGVYALTVVGPLVRTALRSNRCLKCEIVGDGHEAQKKLFVI
jgi:hypothetical protein